jgi:hypothetical protein
MFDFNPFEQSAMDFGPLPADAMKKDKEKADKYKRFADAMMLSGMAGMQSGNPWAALGGAGALLLSGKINKRWGG